MQGKTFWEPGAQINSQLCKAYFDPWTDGVYMEGRGRSRTTV